MSGLTEQRFRQQYARFRGAEPELLGGVLAVGALILMQLHLGQHGTGTA
ncbi:hypothetical protein [Streptomyces stelliscabiei]